MHPLARLVVSVAFVGAPTSAVITVPAAAQAASGVQGKWHTPDKQGVVEIKELDGVLTGTLVASDNPKAPLGVEILRGFTKRGGVWVGTIYAPKRGRTAEATLRLEGDTIVIEVEAGVFSKTVIWTRVKSK